MTATKGFIFGAATSPLDTRKADASKLVCNVDGTPRIGVLGLGPSIVTSDPSTAPMRVAVAVAGLATQRVAGDGVAHWTNDGSLFVTVTKPGSQSWITTVYAKHDDTTNGDADNLPIIGTVTGSAAAVPTEAAIPAGALKIATILIPSTATSTQSANVVITNVYPMTAMSGGAVPFRTKAEMDAWTTAAPGQLANVIADTTSNGLNNGIWRRGSGAWTYHDVGDWVAYTPTLTNMTLGNGTLTAYARRVGSDVEVRFDFLLGSTSAMGTLPRLSHPIAAVALAHKYAVEGTAIGYDLSADTPYILGLLAIDVNTVQVVPNASGAVTTTVNAAAPFTWVAGDHLSGKFSYQAA